MERFVKYGDTIKVHFTGTLDDGSIFDSSVNRNPLKFKVGAGEVIQGFDEAVIGMKLNQEKIVNINSDKAYGPKVKELIVNVDKNNFPSTLKIKLNQKYKVPTESGESMIVKVTNISGDTIELDGNHPLAGKNLTFKITLVEIEN
ncbi:MAG: FKBP-type peptidyl-prolyl cis-trans isomerase [Ignavibacteriae bacterium]|nr:FKBP-type peptidyl-prolyl cis-trans isomerase [Ignavibacteriota bacterium]